MLDIIEDLQRQHQQQQQLQQQEQLQQLQQPQKPVKRVPCVPPKPARQRAAPRPAPAAPPRATRNERKKMATPQPENDDLCGADYHLYEEIVYDLGTKSNRCHDVPPPLPARPWHRRCHQPTKPVKPVRWDVPLKLVTPQQGRPNALANLYTLASQQQQRQQQRQQQQQQLQQQLKTTKLTALVQCSHDDEYGFRAIPHMV